jgi:hypothetical protein
VRWPWDHLGWILLHAWIWRTRAGNQINNKHVHRFVHRMMDVFLSNGNIRLLDVHTTSDAEQHRRYG